MKNICGLSRMAAMVAVMAMVAWGAAGEEISPNAFRVRDAIAPGTVLNATNARFYNSVSGELFADIMQTTVSGQREFRRALPSIINYSQTAHTQVPESMLASSVCPTSMCAPNNKWVMWDTPFMVNETKKRDDGYLGYQQQVSGFATGISRMLDETSAIGLAVGYDARKVDGRDHYHMRERSDTFHAALYGGTTIAWFFIDAYAGYSRTWHRSERNVEYGAVGHDINKANFNDTVLSAGLKVSYVCILPSEWRITPSIGLDYSHVRLDAINEHGWYNGSSSGPSNSGLSTDKSSYNNIAMPIMVSVNKTFSNGWFCFGGPSTLWTPEVRAGYVPQFGSGRADISARFANGTPGNWKAKSTKIGDYATVGTGLKIKVRDKFIFAIDYNYSFASDYNNHTVTGTYGVSF